MGAGPLDPFVCDPYVTDVLVNGPDQVWIERGDGLERVDVDLGGADAVRRLAQRLAADCGRRLDDAHPFVDARLPDGTRLHAVLSPVAVRGPYLSLRMFRSRAFTLPELVSAGTLTPGSAELLAALVSARLALLVTGGTGSGKTTLLATLLGLVPPHERIVIVEDATELRPDHPHVLSLEARTSNVEGAGTVDLKDLVRQALRMRPDRIVVGECRGAEVAELLTALNTGHDGGAGTVHANSPADVPARLEALALPHGLDRAGLHAQVAAALRMVLHLRRTPSGRVLDEVSLLRLGPDGRGVRAIAAWRAADGPGPAASEVAGLLRARGVAVPSVLLARPVRSVRGPMRGGEAAGAESLRVPEGSGLAPFRAFGVPAQVSGGVSEVMGLRAGRVSEALASASGRVPATPVSGRLTKQPAQTPRRIPEVPAVTAC